MPANSLVSDLIEQIKSKQVVIFAGAGISIGSVEPSHSSARCASWKGLLQAGIEYCHSLRLLTEDQAKRRTQDLASNDIDDLLVVAEYISRKLGAPSHGEFRRWLNETVGQLRHSNTDFVESLVTLDCPIVTTNYDNIISKISGYDHVTWLHPDRIERVLRRDETGIVHIHGHYKEPESVILGIASYEKIIRNLNSDAILKACRTLKTMLFIGFGAGLEDPNFRALLKWSRDIFGTSQYRHFRLVKQDQLRAVSQMHDSAERIFVVSFGTEYADLPRCLKALSTGDLGYFEHL